MSLRFLLLSSAFLITAPITAEDRSQIDFFEKKIRPVLVKKCYRCHSQEAQKKKKLKGGLILDTKNGSRQGGDTGPAVVPGKPEESLLLKALNYQGDLEMPPSGKLPESIIQDFTVWIKNGAVDPRGDTTTVQTGIDWSKAKDHWAFQPLARTDLPVNKDSQWATNAIDRFILARLEEASLKPMRPATRRELIRRAYFDVIGLPPSPEEVEAFLSDSAPNAYEKLVERLLASPRYGERWARFWLDVARYAEDQAHTFQVRKKVHAYQYRNWVIQAFNRDMPFDRFAKLQVAGDLLPEPGSDRFEQLAGLGFFGLGAEYYKNSDKAQALADELDDRIDTLTRGFLGLTVSCARCHDHKYDPIPTQDYYSLAGVFSGSRLADTSLARPEEMQAFQQGKQKINEANNRIRAFLREEGKRMAKESLKDLSLYLTATWKVQQLRQARARHSLREISQKNGIHEIILNRWLGYLDPRNASKIHKSLSIWHATKPNPGTEWDAIAVPDAITKMASDLQKQLLDLTSSKDRRLKKDEQSLVRAILLDGRGPHFLGEKEAERLLTGKEKEQLNQLRAQLEQAKKDAPPSPPMAHVISGGGQDLKVYVRGDPANQGIPAPRRFLRILSGTDQPRQGKDFTRRELAEAIANRDNPLTARVIVNRIWQHHFGRGLVATPGNFGKLGDKPSHPKLLDWLTLRFIESGWSIKSLHRLMLLSSTYQLSSDSNGTNKEVDPANHLLWRMPRRRLDVEAFRDSLLAVADQLDLQKVNGTLSLSDSRNHSRTVHARISRHQLNGFLRLFDFPDANVTSATRTTTTVPQQQLFVLNSDFMVRQAQAFAGRLERELSDDEQRIQRAYALALGRQPTQQEIHLIREFLQSSQQSKEKLTPWAQFAQAILSSNEFLYID